MVWSVGTEFVGVGLCWDAGQHPTFPCSRDLVRIAISCCAVLAVLDLSSEFVAACFLEGRLRWTVLGLALRATSWRLVSLECIVLVRPRVLRRQNLKILPLSDGQCRVGFIIRCVGGTQHRISPRKLEFDGGMAWLFTCCVRVEMSTNGHEGVSIPSLSLGLVIWIIFLSFIESDM
jgi:hypothetical protein